jgi:hypothetical protein
MAPGLSFFNRRGQNQGGTDEDDSVMEGASVIADTPISEEGGTGLSDFIPNGNTFSGLKFSKVHVKRGISTPTWTVASS